MANETVTSPQEDLLERARWEVSEDRRIASLMRQPRNRETLLRRASVTEELIAEVEKLRSGYANWNP